VAVAGASRPDKVAAKQFALGVQRRARESRSLANHVDFLSALVQD